jgi:hypothetical protein
VIWIVHVRIARLTLLALVLGLAGSARAANQANLLVI